jgi:hypothetical protein
MPCPSHPPRINYSNNTWRRAQIMKLLYVFFFFFGTVMYV